MHAVIFPNTLYQPIHAPLIFLAGPIRSAPNWQDKAMKIIFGSIPQEEIVIASPRRESKGYWSDKTLQSEYSFERQRAWEIHYIHHARKQGCVMFWLAGEEKHHCDKAYGATTRLELGEILGAYSYNKEIQFCIGAEEKFSELHTVIYDISLYAPGKRIHQTLEETCIEAVKTAKETYSKRGNSIHRNML